MAVHETIINSDCVVGLEELEPPTNQLWGGPAAFLKFFSTGLPGQEDVHTVRA